MVEEPHPWGPSTWPASSPLLFVAAQRLPGGVAATLGAAQPIIVAGLAVVVLSEHPSVWRLIWGGIGVVGVALVVLGPQAGLDALGVAAGLGGAVSMGLGVVLTKRWGRPDGVSALTPGRLAAHRCRTAAHRSCACHRRCPSRYRCHRRGGLQLARARGRARRLRRLVRGHPPATGDPDGAAGPSLAADCGAPRASRDRRGAHIHPAPGIRARSDRDDRGPARPPSSRSSSRKDHS